MTVQNSWLVGRGWTRRNEPWGPTGIVK